MFKVRKFKKPDDFYFWSSFTVACVAIGAILLASFIPQVETALAQKILEILIGLDGVLFGFTGVMIGLFLRNSHKLSETTLRRCFMFALMAFWSYILSIFGSFLILALGQQKASMQLFTPVFLTIFGSFCSSIYLVMVFIEEIFPEEKERAS